MTKEVHNYISSSLFAVIADRHPKARYCAVLVSENYKAKRWTKHEWRSAQERALSQPDKEYILPIRIDDTSLDGLFNTMGMLDARKVEVRTIARMIFEKVGNFSDVNSIVRLADQKYRENLIDEAFELVSDAKFDTNIEALRIKSYAFEKKADYIRAINALDLILKQRPDDFLTHFHLGIYCFRSGDFGRAVEHYEIADGLSPNHPTIQSDLPAARRLLANPKSEVPPTGYGCGQLGSGKQMEIRIQPQSDTAG